MSSNRYGHDVSSGALVRWDRLYPDALDPNFQPRPVSERIENVASIEAVPERLLPRWDRAFALLWAREGFRVWAFVREGSWWLYYGPRLGVIWLGHVLPGDDTTIYVRPAAGER